MVLSNKKLKQKIRVELAESIAASEEAQNHPTKAKVSNDPDQNSLKFLLDSVTQKPRLSKREKRREKILPFQESVENLNASGDVIDQKENGEDGSEGVKKQKKRKREGKGGERMENGALANVEAKKSKNKKKNKKQKKKKAGNVELKKDAESVNGVSGEQSVAVSIKASESQEITDNSTKVYVGGIPYYSTEDDIRSFFESCGSITEVDCMKFPDTGKFRGIAIISFKTEAATKRALALDGADMGGLFLRIQPYKTTVEKKVSDFSPAIVEGYNRIYVGNLSWDITEDDLKNFFSDCSVSSIRFGEDKETGEFRGYAHVDFSDSLSVTLALKLDQKIVYGRPVRIRCAVPAKKVAQSNTKSDPTSRNAESVAVNSDNVTVNTDNVAVNTEISTISGKIRRRTCYECGEKGHLTSSCPKKQTADTVKSVPTNTNADNVGVSTDNVKFSTDNVEVSAVSGKIRRRTCYECGEKGHLTSSCPNKQPDESIKSMPTSKNAYNVEASINSVEASTDKVDASTVSGKIRRRTCYECGEKGHLSSSCPKKQAAESMNLDAS